MTPEEIQALLMKYNDERKLLQRERLELCKPIDEKIKSVEFKITKLINSSLPSNLTVGSWNCMSSPIGKCAYDYQEDPCGDSCVYCGEPDERK